MKDPARGGRFEGSVDPAFARYSSSLAADGALVRFDLAGSVAHATMLGECGLVPKEDAARLVGGLRDLWREHRAGRWSPDGEDIHMAVEATLTARLGPAGRRLHTARSRNDQVALDLALWTREAEVDLLDALLSLARALAEVAERHRESLVPGYTHLQRAQPVTLGHLLLSHAARALRDALRVVDALARLDASPLGAGAIAGTSLPIRPETTARLLGFAGTFSNATDATSSRDAALEAVWVATMASLDAASLAEDLVLWSTEEFGFVRLGEGHSTGSSLMPQKRNPDAAELARAAAGAPLGAFVQIATTVKGLPSGYNRDLQAMKPPLFAAIPGAAENLRILADAIRGATFDEARMANALAGGFPEATLAADVLVERGVPFREAHDVVGRAVRESAPGFGSFLAVPPERLAKADPRLDAALVSEVRRRCLPAAVAARLGVDAQLRRTQQRLGILAKAAEDAAERCRAVDRLLSP